MIKLIKKHKIPIGVAVVIVATVVLLVKLNSNSTAETISPTFGDIVRTVKISGKVVPVQKVDLGFELSGIVTSVSKDVGDSVGRGDVVARIDSTSITSNILKAEAELNLAQANLDKLDGSGIFEAQIDNAKRALIQTLVSAHTTADDAVFNKTDQLFIRPYSSRPELGYSFVGQIDLRDSINETRVVLGEDLKDWKSLLSGLDVSNYTTEHLSKTKKYLAEVSAYISNISQAVNAYEENVSLTQATIDTYKNAVLLAKDNLNQASQNIISAEDRLNGLLLDVPVQVARVESARASLLNYRSELSKTILTSPISGIVSKQDAQVGQVVSPATNIVSIISRNIEIESFVPEALIAGVKIGNLATISLDAYGTKENFSAKVTHIDPAETLRDGVSTYKTLLTFDTTDNRIRSGMTANINIETFRKDGVLTIPERVLVRDETETYIYTMSSDGTKEKMVVEVGERDSSGNIELLSPISDSVEIIINPETL